MFHFRISSSYRPGIILHYFVKKKIGDSVTVHVACISRVKYVNLDFHLLTASRGVATVANRTCPFVNINRYSRRCMARNRIGTALVYEVGASEYVLGCICNAADSRACLYAYGGCVWSL